MLLIVTTCFKWETLTIHNIKVWCIIPPKVIIIQTITSRCLILWIFYDYCKCGLQMFLTSSWLTCIWSKRLLWQVSGHFLKMFSTFCTFAAVFFSMHKTFSVFRTNWNKVAHVVNRSFEKSNRASFIIEIHESPLTFVTFNGFLQC